MQNVEKQSFRSKNSLPAANFAESTEKLPTRVGEDWPKLLTKKWLAVHFGCFNGREICRRRFRRHVLTAEVLAAAGISEAVAFSRSTKTFDVIQSQALTRILNPQ